MYKLYQNNCLIWFIGVELNFMLFYLITNILEKVILMYSDNFVDYFLDITLSC